MSDQKAVSDNRCGRRGWTALAAGLAYLVPTALLWTADKSAPARRSLLEWVLGGVVPVNLRAELSREARAFVNEELKISAEEPEKVRTFIIPVDLVRGILSQDDYKQGTLAYFYMFREQLEETKEPILVRMGRLSKDRDKRRPTYSELEQFFDLLVTKLYGPIRVKKQYAILILARDEDEDVLTRDFRILHELKHHTRNLPVFFAKSTGDAFEAEAMAFQMQYLAAVREKNLEQIIGIRLGGRAPKEAGMKMREFEKTRRFLITIWEEQVRREEVNDPMNSKHTPRTLSLALFGGRGSG